MLLLPLAYFASFFYSLVAIFKKKYFDILAFYIVGLPIYITTLAILEMYGLQSLVLMAQYSKEIISILSLFLILYTFKNRPTFSTTDYLVTFYFVFCGIYILLPLGSFNMYQKIIAFKNIAFFPIIYFIGRLISLDALNISKYQVLTILIGICFALIAITEYASNTHFQSHTGYAQYNLKYMGIEPQGSYGLSWTFEIEGGIKRFSSVFANPLEFAAGTIVLFAMIASAATLNNIRPTSVLIIGMIAGIISVILALSRASFVGLMITIYAYCLLMRYKQLLNIIHVGLVTMIVGFTIFLLNTDIGEFVINTINFSNSSSLSHLVEWIDGLEAIRIHPMGMGLGESGRVAGEFGLNTGGENQLIILGVQTGVIPVIVYIAMMIAIIRVSIVQVRGGNKLSKQVGIIVFLLKIGLMLPLLTASAESYLYISHVSWFFSGLLINLSTISPKTSSIE